MKAILIAGVLVIISGAAITAVVLTPKGGIKVSLLNNAGVMIEKGDTRLYIDPYDLPSKYSNYPADAIFITHDHGDHYDETSIDLIITENTSLFVPAVMPYAVTEYDATPVQPLDEFSFSTFNVTCFYMYTMPTSGQSSHPRANNYTSYIIEIDGFTIFHAGDSWNLNEYEQLTGEIDLALLPLGPGCQTMTEMDVVHAVETIEPSYMIPIHYTDESKDTFVDLYKEMVEDCGCRFLNLEYYESYRFNSS
jgi:L-ascorbate metabolism protein UlaG (beta-lactamase superfamily)